MGDYLHVHSLQHDQCFHQGVIRMNPPTYKEPLPLSDFKAVWHYLLMPHCNSTAKVGSAQQQWQSQGSCSTVQVKGFDCPGAVGQDVMTLLRDAFHRKVRQCSALHGGC